MRYRDEDFIGLTSMALVGLMIMLAQIQDPVDNREIDGFH